MNPMMSPNDWQPDPQFSRPISTASWKHCRRNAPKSRPGRSPSRRRGGISRAEKMLHETADRTGARGVLEPNARQNRRPTTTADISSEAKASGRPRPSSPPASCCSSACWPADGSGWSRRTARSSCRRQNGIRRRSSFQVATADEVVVLHIEGRDTDALASHWLPVHGPLELAVSGEVHVTRVCPRAHVQEAPNRPMIWARTEAED